MEPLRDLDASLALLVLSWHRLDPRHWRASDAL
jgi:hypothetical protein